MTDTQKTLDMCLSKTILPIEIRTNISHFNRIREQDEEIRKNFSYVLDDVSGMGEFLIWVIEASKAPVKSDSHNDLVEWSKCWGVEFGLDLLSVKSDSHETLCDCSQLPPHYLPNGEMSHYDIWRLYCGPLQWFNDVVCNMRFWESPRWT